MSLYPYPLKLTPKFTKKFNQFREDCNNALDFNLSKIGFYNFILLIYYIKNRAVIARREIEFWSQDYFSKGDEIDFQEVVNLFNKMLDS